MHSATGIKNSTHAIQDRVSSARKTGEDPGLLLGYRTYSYYITCISRPTNWASEASLPSGTTGTIFLYICVVAPSLREGGVPKITRMRIK